MFKCKVHFSYDRVEKRIPVTYLCEADFEFEGKSAEAYDIAESIVTLYEDAIMQSVSILHVKENGLPFERVGDCRCA